MAKRQNPQETAKDSDMVDLNVEIPSDTYQRLYAAKGMKRETIKTLVLAWIERGLAEIGLPPKDAPAPPAAKPPPRKR